MGTSQTFPENYHKANQALLQFFHQPMEEEEEKKSSGLRNLYIHKGVDYCTAFSDSELIPFEIKRNFLQIISHHGLLFLIMDRLPF